jgi:hypothetical protein
MIVSFSPAHSKPLDVWSGAAGGGLFAQEVFVFLLQHIAGKSGHESADGEPYVIGPVVETTYLPHRSVQAKTDPFVFRHLGRGTGWLLRVDKLHARHRGTNAQQAPRNKYCPHHFFQVQHGGLLSLEMILF